MDKNNNIFKTLGIKPNSQLVLEYLITHKLSPAKDIAINLNLPKSTVYDALEELKNESLVTEYMEDRGRMFEVADKERLTRVSDQKIAEFKENQKNLLEYLESVQKEESSSKPKIKFYLGSEGIRQAFRDIMWHSGCKESYLMWSTKEMLEILGAEFSEWHSSMRLRHKVVLQVLRKDSDRGVEKDVEGLDAGWKTQRNIRHVPPEIDWNMSYWVYDNKVLFTGGKNDKFAFSVHSKEFANLMIVLWKQMWEISKE